MTALSLSVAPLLLRLGLAVVNFQGLFPIKRMDVNESNRRGQNYQGSSSRLGLE